MRNEFANKENKKLKNSCHFIFAGMFENIFFYKKEKNENNFVRI